MSVVLEAGAAQECVTRCTDFVQKLKSSTGVDTQDTFAATADSFPTARQIGAVYDEFFGRDLRELVASFATQVEAMAVVFAVAGGLIEEQDQVVADALKAASGPGPELRSLAAASAAVGLPSIAAAVAGSGELATVGGEDVSAAPLEQIARAAGALDPNGFARAAERATTVATTLRDASTDLDTGLGRVLGSSWQGEFADNALYATSRLTTSAHDLADSLDAVSRRADNATNGYSVTRDRVGEQATSALTTVTGPTEGHPAIASPDARSAAVEQARSIVHSVYSPAVVDANLAGLDFPQAYRVVGGIDGAGAGGVDPVSMWNLEGVIRPAPAADPATLGGHAGTTSNASGADTLPGATGTAPTTAGVTTADDLTRHTTARDAATEQAFHGGTSASSHDLSTGAAASGTTPSSPLSGRPAAGIGPGAAPVDAGTTSAGVPSTWWPGGARQSDGGVASAAGAGLGAGRTGTTAGGRTRDRDRGFGSGAGSLAGAGTLAGAGALAGTSAGGSHGGAGAAAGAAGPGGRGAFGSSGVTAGPGSTSGGAPGAGAAGAAGTGGAAAAGRGAGSFGMMPAGAAQGGQQRRGEHQPAGYLVDALNTTDLLGTPPKATPAVLGAAHATTPPAPVATPPTRATPPKHGTTENPEPHHDAPGAREFDVAALSAPSLDPELRRERRV